MISPSFSDWLHDVTKPRHPHYFPVQTLLFGTIGFISTACLTSISPMRGMKAIVLAFLVSQVTTPWIAKCFRKCQNMTLVPFIGQIFRLTSTMMITTMIYYLAGHPLSTKEIRQLCVAFFICRFVIFRIINAEELISKSITHSEE